MSLRSFLSTIQDRLMFHLIGRTIIYNVSWEDPRIDCELLDLTKNDTVMMLTSGGCNVLDMILEGAKKVVAVDLNPRQNALLELKIVCIQNLTYEQFYELFAKSNYPLFVEVYDTKLRPHLSAFAQQFWDENKSFFKNVMWSGASGFAARALLIIVRLFGLGGLIDKVRDCATIEEQREIYARYEGYINFLSRFINSTKRLWCPFIAVPASQLHLFDGNIVKHVVDNCFHNTHIAKDNYFYYAYMYGSYTKENCPRYLKAEYFNTLKANVKNIDIQTKTLKEAALCYPDNYFSRYILLDHMDWMPMSMILDEWSVFVQKARADVRILWRSFASYQHIAPLKYLQLHEENVDAAHAMYPDRVSMYNSTHLATIPKNITILPRTEFKPRGTVCDDMTVLFNNMLHPISGKDHQARLESFYTGQARSYDVFRHRFLHGRVPMIEAMPTPKNGVWVDLGGGTAANLEHLKDNMNVFSKVIVLDLCRPLLDIAQNRIDVNGWTNVETVCGDATSPNVEGLPKAGTVDLVTMSYSLTMIPDWEAALRNAFRLLRPGGWIAISDFTVTEDHGCCTRRFWPAIFKHDGVMLRPDHIPTLQAMFREVHVQMGSGGFPYIPFLESPFYYFVGQKV